jgi:hypothetical protein
MATYLQGVTPYIPQIQPFQEDLNFYANVLGTKQQQYDSNYKQLNQVYGQYFYADLTREGNIEKKEELIKNINFNLQRVAGLDLSLEQNVNQAVQVFKPFYEERYLMKDMAWTKNYKREKGLAEGLLRSSDEERSGQYWDTGVKALDYKRMEFAESSDEESLNFGSVRYTPYKNVTKEAMAIAKEAGLSIESVDFSPDGKWIIKQKNGQPLTEPLSKLFEATLGNDPAVQRIYQTQAYVNRKDYAYGNAAMFNGDVKAAEMKYLEDSFNMFKQQTAIEKKQLEATSTVYDNKIKDIEDQIKKGTADPQAKMFLEQLKSNKEINDSALSRMSALSDKYEEQSSTLSTSTGFQNPYGDIETLRNKVDAGMAASLLQKDLGEAAQIFAYRNSSVDIDANPYAVNEQKHMFSMQQVAARNAGLERAARIRNAGDRKNMIDKAKLDTGFYHMIDVPIGQDAEGNVIYDTQVIPNENMEELFIKPGGESAAGEVNAKRVSVTRSKEVMNETLVPYFQRTYDALSRLKKADKITDKKIKEVLNGYSLEQFKNYYEKYPDHFSRNVLGIKGLNKLTASIDKFLIDEGNINLDEVKANRDAYLQSRLKADTYSKYLNADQDWRMKTSKQVETELKSQGFVYADHLYDNNGRLRSENEFRESLLSTGKISKADYRAMRVSDAIKNENKSEAVQLLKELGTGTADINKAINQGNLFGILKSTSNYAYISSMSTVGSLTKMGLNKIGLDLIKDNIKTDYDAMKKAAGKVYSDSGRIQAPPIVASSGLGTGAGYVPQGISVAPSAPWMKGMTHWNSVVKNIRGLDLLDSDKVRLSASGYGTKLSSVEALGLNMDNDSFTGLMNDMFNQLAADSKNTKTKGSFDIFYSDIAEGKTSRSAINIVPDNEWLNDYLTKKKASIDEDDYGALLRGLTQNGLTIITDRNQMNNTLKKAGTMKPIEAIVDYNNEYTYVDPVSNSKFYVTKDPSGLNKYMYNIQFGIWNPETNSYVATSGNNFGYEMGGDALPDLQIDNFMMTLPELYAYNQTLIQ